MFRWARRLVVLTAGAGALVLATIGMTGASASTTPTKTPAQAVAGVCGDIVDNGGQGLDIRGNGAGNDVYMSGIGNCFTAIDKTWESAYDVYAYEYENGDGNCLYVSRDGTGPVTLSSTCDSLDQYELIMGFAVSDVSGYTGLTLICADSSCTSDFQNQICAEGNSGSDVNVESSYNPNSNPDRCTWAVP